MPIEKITPTPTVPRTLRAKAICTQFITSPSAHTGARVLCGAPGGVSAGRTSDRLHVRWPYGLQMKFDVYERVRDPLHGRHKVGGVREGFAQVLDRCLSLRVHVALLCRAPGSMSSPSGVSKSSSSDTESRISPFQG